MENVVFSFSLCHQVSWKYEPGLDLWMCDTVFDIIIIIIIIIVIIIIIIVIIIITTTSPDILFFSMQWQTRVTMTWRRCLSARCVSTMPSPLSCSVKAAT